MHLLITLVLLLQLSPAITAHIFYTDKDDEQSVPMSLNRDRILLFQEKILNILGLQRPDPNHQAYNADEIASRFMSALYELMAENERSPGFVLRLRSQTAFRKRTDSGIDRILNDIRKDSLSADTIVSFIPEDIRVSEESFGSSLYEAGFSVRGENDGLMIGARLFVVLENPPADTDGATFLRVFRKTTSAELVEIGSQTLTNYGQLALVSLNVTQLVEHWLSSQQPFSTVQKIYLELSGPNGTAREVAQLKNLHCFGVGLFVDKPHAVERRIRRSLADQLEIETTEDPQQFETLNETFAETTSVPRRLDRLSTAKDKRCGLRSLYVDFKDLGWSDWIITPQGYYADFCAGDCGFPLDTSTQPINHAIVQTLVHILDKRRAHQAKCAPTELYPQNILFLNGQQNLVMKKYQNMRVKQCGCR